MNNDEMNAMIKKAQEMIKNNQVPDDLKNLASMFQASNTATNQSNLQTNGNQNNGSQNNFHNNKSQNNESQSNFQNNNGQYNETQNNFRSNKEQTNSDKSTFQDTTSQSQNNQNSQQNFNNFTSNIDMGTLMKMQSIMSKLNTMGNDDMSKLLISLKPYMRSEKKGKIDEYINLIKMGKMTQLLESLGNNKMEE